MPVSPEQFWLPRRNMLFCEKSDDDVSRVQLQGSIDGAAASPLRVLWEKADLPAGKFADDVARFWNLPRLNLQDLMNASSAVGQFSERFLREASVFPFRGEQGCFGLAVSDPIDAAAISAVEIACGSSVEVAVASFNDISTVLERQLDERSASPWMSMNRNTGLAMMISIVCAIWRAVRRSYEPSTICSSLIREMTACGGALAGAGTVRSIPSTRIRTTSPVRKDSR
jgi:hypothetical protein